MSTPSLNQRRILSHRSRSVGRRDYLFAMALIGVFACTTHSAQGPLAEGAPVSDSPTTKPDKPNDKPIAQAKPSRAEAVKMTDSLFIGRVRYAPPLECENFGSLDAPSARIPRILHDASDYPQRHSVSLDVIQIFRGVGDIHVAPGVIKEEPLPQKSVDFALGSDAFQGADTQRGAAVYDKQYCQRLNGWLAAKFLVVHAFEVHVDHGNSAPREWHDLGSRSTMGNAGFKTLEEAQTYAKSLLLPAGLRNE